jgi:tetratricopeptide (TPR) repeat protein
MVSRLILRSLAVLMAATGLFAQSEQQGGLAPPPPEPAHALTPERRGDVFMARKMYREAIETYQQIAPQSPIILNKIGIAYHQLMQLDTAKRFYERAIRMNPKYSEAINNLGTVHYAKKSYRRAVSAYRKALKLAPESASIYSNLGTAFFARKKYDDAFKAYQQALALDPEVFEHRSSYGVLLQERSVEERAKFHFYLARTYASAGIYDRALQYLRRALEEGFKERRRMEDAEFAGMQEMPEFQELLKLEPKIL